VDASNRNLSSRLSSRAFLRAEGLLTRSVCEDLGWIALCAALMSPSVDAADDFKRLAAAEIRATFTGKVITDESHWSDHFRPGGTLRSIILGQLELGTWKIDGDELCLTRMESKKAATQCYEIWLWKDRVEYRRDGVMVLEGVLRDEWL
jgi:hypothetical protein